MSNPKILLIAGSLMSALTLAACDCCAEKEGKCPEANAKCPKMVQCCNPKCKSGKWGQPAPKHCHLKPSAAKQLEIGKKMTDSLCKNDCKEFASALPQPVQKDGETKIKSDMEHLNRKHGKLDSAEPLTILASPQQDCQIWKLQFISNGPDGKPVVQDTLFQITFSPDGTDVIGFGFL